MVCKFPYFNKFFRSTFSTSSQFDYNVGYASFDAPWLNEQDNRGKGVMSYIVLDIFLIVLNSKRPDLLWRTILTKISQQMNCCHCNFVFQA
jgi:hypothetical protein